MSMALNVIATIRAIQPEALPAFVAVLFPNELLGVARGHVLVSTDSRLDSPARERISTVAVTGTYPVTFEPT